MPGPGSGPCPPQAPQAGEELREVARQLRALVVGCPPRTAAERSTARRLEGAAVVLAALAQRPESG